MPMIATACRPPATALYLSLSSACSVLSAANLRALISFIVDSVIADATMAPIQHAYINTVDTHKYTQ